MARLSFAERALADLNDIAAHISQDNPVAAARLIDRLEGICRLLATRPGIGRTQHALRPGLRSHVVGRYVVFYRTISGGIEVVRVLHGARDVETAFGEDDG